MIRHNQMLGVKAPGAVRRGMYGAPGPGLTDHSSVASAPELEMQNGWLYVALGGLPHPWPLFLALARPCSACLKKKQKLVPYPIALLSPVCLMQSSSQQSKVVW